MRIIVAVLMGFLSGFLIYMMGVMLTADFGASKAPSAAFVFIFLFGGWIVSSALLLRGTRTTGKVLTRGFLLGAAEWFAMILVGFIFSGRAVTSTSAGLNGDAAATAGAAMGGGLMAILTSGVSIMMAIVCLIGFAITYFSTREMKPELAGATRKCPECAELIQPEARKCKHCGASVSPIAVGA